MFVITFIKKILEAVIFFEDDFEQFEQIGDVGSGIKAMFEMKKLITFMLVEFDGKFVRAVTDDFEQPVQIVFYLLDVTVGKRGGQQGGDFPVAFFAESINELQRVGSYQLSAIVLFVKSFEDFFQPGYFLSHPVPIFSFEFVLFANHVGDFHESGGVVAFSLAEL